MDKKELAYEDYKNGMKYKDIADKYGVSLSTVKSWAARYWKSKKVADSNKKVAANNKKVAKKVAKKTQPKSRGAPKGNRNAAGNTGGAPVGNTNAFKHGGYSEIYWDTADEREKEMIADMPDEAEFLLLEQIKLLSVRERRLMRAINKYSGIKGELAVSGVVTSNTKRSFSDDSEGQEEKEIYRNLKKEKIDEGKISYLGYDKFTQTTTEATYNIILRLERELTAVQSKKTKCIEALAKLHSENDNNNDKALIEDWINAVKEGADNE